MATRRSCMQPRYPSRGVAQRLDPRHAFAVLLVEDDPYIGPLVATALREAEYRVDLAIDGAAGLDRFGSTDFDLLILDLMLPGMNGLEICRRIRTRNRFTPILMLTAKASKQDVVKGLELGADEYVTKPFHMAELLARIQALFRRVNADLAEAETREVPGPFCHGPLMIDTRKRNVSVDGRRIALTAKEFDLLQLFAGNVGHTFTRAELLNLVWGTEFAGYEHTVNTHINRLRAKIEPRPSDPKFIETVWGIGYRFSEMTPH